MESRYHTVLTPNNPHAWSRWRRCRRKSAPTPWLATAGLRIPSCESLEWVRTHDSAEVPRELLLPVRARLHRRPGPRGDVLRGHLGAGRHRDRRRAALGRAGQVVALPGLLALRIHHPARAGSPMPRRAIGRPARRCWPPTRRSTHACRRPWPSAAAPGRHAGGRLPAQHRRPRLRRGALPALFGRSDQRGAGGQHPHPGKADPPPEGVRIPGAARDGRRDRRRLRRRARLAPGRGTPRANRWRPRWPSTSDADSYASMPAKI